MSEKHLHIVSFDIPFPANYGGVIDVHNKIIALKNIGFIIHLHCFFSNRKPNAILLDHCYSVNYYPRKMAVAGISLRVPFIVSSRNSKQLEENLLKDDYPILLEGIHCTHLLLNKAFANRKVLVRAHNIESFYYEKLANHERNIFKKLYFKIESFLLKKYEKKIASQFPLAAISDLDASKFALEMGAKKLATIPAFTAWNCADNLSSFGTNCLYHGNLSINENENAVIWLIENIFKNSQFQLCVAGNTPSNKLIQTIASCNNIQLIANPSDEEMLALIKTAHINVLPSLNKTGVKLKILNALFNGRFCLVNLAAIEGSFLAQTCEIANSPEEFSAKIGQLLNTEFEDNVQLIRRSILHQYYSNEVNARLLSSWLC